MSFPSPLAMGTVGEAALSHGGDAFVKVNNPYSTMRATSRVLLLAVWAVNVITTHCERLGIGVISRSRRIARYVCFCEFGPS